MVVTYGRKCPEGFLPVFSVDSEQEAIDLLTLTCPKNAMGQWFSRELAMNQSLETLDSFSDTLHEAYELMKLEN